MDKTRRKHSDWGKPVPKRQTWYVLIHIWMLDIEQRITMLQSTPPENLGNKENSKRDIYVPLKKLQGTWTTEKIGSKRGAQRKVTEWEGEKRRSEEDRGEQEVWVGRRIEETQIRCHNGGSQYRLKKKSGSSEMPWNVQGWYHLTICTPVERLH